MQSAHINMIIDRIILFMPLILSPTKVSLEPSLDFYLLRAAHVKCLGSEWSDHA